MSEIKIERSAGTVIIRDDPSLGLCILMLKTFARYDLPKGHVENKDASLFDAAARETFEECGFTVVQDPDAPLDTRQRVARLIRGGDAIECFNVNNKTGALKKIVYLFPEETQCAEALILPNKKTQIYEHQSFKWEPVESVSSSGLHPYLQAGVMRAISAYMTHRKIDEAIRKLERSV